MKNLTVVDKLVKLDGIFDDLLSCAEVIWDEIKHGDPELSGEDQKEVVELIASIILKYNKLNEEFNKEY